MKKTIVLLSVLLVCFDALSQSKSTLVYEQADEVEEGDGARVHRLFPKKGLKHYDPYVLFDDFIITPPSGFPDHFHSGFEVVTYLLGGKLKHEDSQGNKVVLEPGDIQCFTTGSGIVHSEMPQGDSLVHGFQIWINLPKEDKQISPGYKVVKADHIPVVHLNDKIIRKTIVGQGTTVRTRAELLIEQYDIKAGARYKFVLPSHYKGFLYVVSGKALFEERICKQGEAVFLTTEDIEVQATEDVSILLVSGLPLQESIRRRGSVVK